MNPLFYPSNVKPRESKSGLEKHRKIMHYTDAPSNESIKDNIPDSWFYNNNNANKIWQSLEVDPVVKFEQGKLTDNPFAKIDESTNRIRQMIANYELTDQELLVNLMTILEQDGEFFGSYQDDDALLEAKLRLGAMINDHSGNAEAQEKIIESLRKWFSSISKKSQTEGDGELKNLKDVYNIDVNQLAEIINSSFETREINSEQLQLLHRSVVDNLTRQIRDMRRKISEQEEMIEELNKTIESQKNFRKRQMQNLKKDEVDIMHYQRSICEKDARIIDLKSTITEISNENRSIPIEENKEKQDEYIAYSMEKDFELNTRIRSLTNKIAALKQELTDASVQLRLEKQNGFALENKFQLLDRAKKSIEQSLASTNDRYSLLEKKLKDKTDELEKMQKNFESSAVAEAVCETKKEYEDKIHEILDANRANVFKAVENVEKRYKKQIAELMRAVDLGESKAAITELNNQHMNEIAIIKKECNDEIENLKVVHGNRLNLLTRHYEQKIGQLINEQKRLQENIEKDREIFVEEKRIEIEEDFSRKIIDCQDKFATEVTNLRSRFEGKVNKLEEKIRNIESERDLLKGIIEENNLFDELPENFNENSPDFNGDEDDVLADSIIQIKNREIEKTVTEKYNALLKAQRYTIEDYKNWEIEKLNDSLRTELNDNFSKLRSEVMNNLCQLRTLLTENKDSTKNLNDIDDAIISTLKIVQANDAKTQDAINRQLIPMNEVESRLSGCNEKINELSGENEFLRFTLKQLNNGKELVNDSNEDLIRAMRTSISAQASQISQTLREYDDMKARIEYYEQKEKSVEFLDELIQTGKELNPILSPSSFLIFSRTESEEMKIEKHEELEELKDEDIVLIDNSNRARPQRLLNRNKKKNSTNDVNETEAVFDDVSTQTDEIFVTKKKVKKVKNSSAKNEPETQPAIESSHSNNDIPASQQPSKETIEKVVDKENENQNKIETPKNQIVEEKQQESSNKNDNKEQENIENDSAIKKETSEANSIKENKEKSENNNANENNENIKTQNDNNISAQKNDSIINEQNDSNASLQNNSNTSAQNNNNTSAQNNNNTSAQNDKNDVQNDDGNEYEYEYEDNYPEIKLIKLSLVKQNCIFQTLPSGEKSESATYSIECPSCHQNLSFDPQISEVSSTIDPVIECPHCHNIVTVDREKYPIMFHDDNFKADSSLQLTPEEKSKIAAMEESIQKQIQDLIKMKQKIRNEQSNQNENSHFRDDLSTSLPTVILTVPNQEQKSEKTSKYGNDKSVDLRVSTNSLAIEIPVLSNEFHLQSISPQKISPRSNSASSLSSRSFTNKFEQNEILSKNQEDQINSAEQKIDNEISKLMEYKQEILSKRSSQKESNRNSDDDDETNAKANNTSRKLKLEEMPLNEANSKPVENIATDLQMSDVQLQKTPQKSTNQIKNEQKPVLNENNKQTVIANSNLNRNSVIYKAELKISQSLFYGINLIEKSDRQNGSIVNNYLKSLAVQTVSEIDSSIEANSSEPIKKLETVEKAVLTLSNLNAFSISDENQVLASTILQKVQSLKDVDTSKIPTEEVDEVVQSARKLLVSFAKENELDQVSIKPLSKEAGGLLSDDVEKLRNENLKYQNEIMVIKEIQTKLKEEVEDINESTKELKLKHEEIIFSLQKLIENIIKSMKEGDGKLDASSLKSLKDQAQYLLRSTKEKENLETDNKEINQLLKERDIEIISLNHIVQNKEGQIEELSSKLAELTAHIEKSELKNEGQKYNVENLEKMDKENKRVIDSMTEALVKMKESSDQLQKKVDQLELENEQLQNKIVMRESENPVYYSYISPFVIFDTDLKLDIPTKGFTLIPGKNKYDQTLSQKDEHVTEKIRVKYNQASKNNQNQPLSVSPKLVVPKTAQSRTRISSNSRNANTNSCKLQSNFGKAISKDDEDYVDYCPVHDEDRKSLLYIKKVDDSKNLTGARGHFDRNPITGNVVFQKTVTNLNKRIFSLQNILQAKSNEMVKLRDQKNESRQNLYKMTIEYQKTQRDLIRAKTNLLLAQEKLEKALKIIEDRDLEIKNLRDLIRQLRTAAAQPVLMHQVMSNIVEDQSNLAAMRAFRRRTTVDDIINANEINPMLKRFAQRQMIVVKKWEKRRQELVRQQRNHLLSVLAGMSLVSAPDKMAKFDSKKEDYEIIKKIPANRKAVTVTSMQTKKKSKNKEKKQENNIIEKSDFDSSWKNANANPQKIPLGMKEGVVAQPL